MGGHNDIVQNRYAINGVSLHKWLRKRYPNRQFVEQETRTLLEGLIARLLIRDYRTGNDIVQMLDRTKKAIDLYEQDPESPSQLSIVGVLTASMLLMDMLADEHLFEHCPVGFDVQPLRVLQKYVPRVLPGDYGS